MWHGITPHPPTINIKMLRTENNIIQIHTSAPFSSPDLFTALCRPSSSTISSNHTINIITYSTSRFRDTDAASTISSAKSGHDTFYETFYITKTQTRSQEEHFHCEYHLWLVHRSSAVPLGWGDKEWEPCMLNTAHCVRKKLEEFFRNRPAHSLHFAVCPWRAFVHHKLRPPLKYSEEQMVLKHDCSPSYTWRTELRYAQHAPHTRTLKIQT